MSIQLAIPIKGVLGIVQSVRYDRLHFVHDEIVDNAMEGNWIANIGGTTKDVQGGVHHGVWWYEAK